MSLLPTSLRESLRATAKEAIWLGVRFEQGPAANIGLYCSRRGGSTWLMEIIGANRGVLTLNEPFEGFTPNMTPYQYSRLPAFDRGAIIHPDPEELDELRRYADEVLAGRMRVNAPHAFWKKGFSYRTNRIALKILEAKPMMDWFERTYGLQSVLLTRHPIPQSLSCIRNGWGTSTGAYLRNEWFLDEVIGNERTVDFARKLAKSGSALERMVLNWTVENLYPLQVLAERPHWLALSYEETVLDRDRVFDEVCSVLELSDRDRMREVASEASRSSAGLSTTDVVDTIRSGDSEQLATRWYEEVSASDKKSVSRILETFQISLYRSDSAVPDWSGYR